MEEIVQNVSMYGLHVDHSVSACRISALKFEGKSMVIDFMVRKDKTVVSKSSHVKERDDCNHIATTTSFELEAKKRSERKIIESILNSAERLRW